MYIRNAILLLQMNPVTNILTSFFHQAFRFYDDIMFTEQKVFK